MSAIAQQRRRLYFDAKVSSELSLKHVKNHGFSLSLAYSFRTALVVELGRASGILTLTSFSRDKCEKIDFNFKVTKRHETFRKIKLMFLAAKYNISCKIGRNLRNREKTVSMHIEKAPAPM